MKQNLIFCLLALSLQAHITEHPLWQPTLPEQVDFDEAMFQEINYGHHHFSAEKDKEVLDFCRNLYNKNQLSNLEPATEPKIPKIIHQIWLGDAFPEKFFPLCKTWQMYHPDWTYIFWVDNPKNYKYGTLVENLSEFSNLLTAEKYKGQHFVIDIRMINLFNQTLFDNAINYGQQSDILRYEILYNFGGLYVDTDFRCLRPFDLLHHCYDFFTGFLNDGLVDLGIGIIGSSPRHPIMQHCITSLKPLSGTISTNNIIKNTGPKHFLESFNEIAPTCVDTVIAFPCTFLYPLPNTLRHLPLKESELFIKDESFGIHYWACSWMRKEAFLQ